MQQRPKLIVVCGLPCAGKSTVADGLSEKLKFAVLSVDPIESGILKSGIRRSFKTGLAAYLVAETLAAEQLELGLSVIVDAVSPVNEARDLWRNLAKQYGADLVIIECVLDPVLHKKRVQTRFRGMAGIPEVSWKQVQDRRRAYLKWEEDRLVLDTANSREQNLEYALAYIEAPRDRNSDARSVARVKIVKAQTSDVDEIGKLWWEFYLFHHNLNPVFPLPDDPIASFTKNHLIRFMASEDALVLVARHGARTVGYALIEVRRHPPEFKRDPYGYIDQMAVTEEFRRKGVGDRLLAEVTSWCHSHGIRRLELGTEAKNSVANSFWTKHGFVVYSNTLFKDI